MKKIWCIEDDENIREIILYTLRSCGFEAAGFSDADTFLKEAEKQQPDLLLLDIMLPGMSGMEILENVRSSAALAQIPVIMTTAKSQELDKVQALDQGADDYLVKPFSMIEMVARIKAVLRRVPEKQPPYLLSRHEIVMNVKDHTVHIDTKPVQLTLKEFALLRLFMTHPGQAFSREELLTLVWQTEYIQETRTVDVHIKSLRSKLLQAKDHIQTVRGIGYRMEPEK